MKKRLSFKQLLFEQQVLGILLFTILVVFLWVVSSIYFSYSASTLSVDDTTTVKPLNPDIPEAPLQELNSRKWWTDDELNQISGTPVALPATSSAVKTQTSTTSAKVSL